MAKKTISNSSVVSSVAVALDSAWSTSETMGRDLVTQCVTVMRKHFGDKGVEKDTREAICEKLAIMRGWSDTSAKSRKSEARALLNEYRNLEALATAYLKETGGCTWHNVVSLARQVSKWDGTKSQRVEASVAALLTAKDNSTKAPNTLTKAEAYKKAAPAIKSMLKMTKGLPKSFRDALLIAATDANFSL